MLGTVLWMILLVFFLDLRCIFGRLYHNNFYELVAELLFDLARDLGVQEIDPRFIRRVRSERERERGRFVRVDTRSFLAFHKDEVSQSDETVSALESPPGCLLSTLRRRVRIRSFTQVMHGVTSTKETSRRRTSTRVERIGVFDLVIALQKLA